MPAAQLIDFIANQEGSLNYRGVVNCTEGPFTGTNAGMTPNPALPGDVYINTADGTVAAGWTGIVSSAIQDGQRVLFDGTNWAIVGAEAGGGDPDTAVLNKTHYVDLGAKIAAATAGGVNQVVAGDGIAVDSGTSTAPVVSIDISALATLT